MGNIAKPGVPFIGEVKLFTDGGSRGNPGPAAIGIIILDRNNLLETFSECVGETTNNQAEYRALLKGLLLCSGHTRRKVTCYMDSELVCKQMNGNYRLKHAELKRLFLQVKQAEVAFDEVTYTHVRREHQKIQKS